MSFIEACLLLRASPPVSGLTRSQHSSQVTSLYGYASEEILFCPLQHVQILSESNYFYFITKSETICPFFLAVR
jgi:hypothetical protein